MLHHGIQIREYTAAYLYHLKDTTNPSLSTLMLTNIQSLKPKINMILHYILQHKLDICFITETWISKNEDLQYIKANLMTQGSNILSCERKKQKRGVWYVSTMKDVR